MKTAERLFPAPCGCGWSTRGEVRIFLGISASLLPLCVWGSFPPCGKWALGRRRRMVFFVGCWDDGKSSLQIKTQERGGADELLRLGLITQPP